ERASQRVFPRLRGVCQKPRRKASRPLRSVDRWPLSLKSRRVRAWPSFLALPEYFLPDSPAVFRGRETRRRWLEESCQPCPARSVLLRIKRRKTSDSSCSCWPKARAAFARRVKKEWPSAVR